MRAIYGTVLLDSVALLGTSWCHSSYISSRVVPLLIQLLWLLLLLWLWLWLRKLGLRTGRLPMLCLLVLPSAIRLLTLLIWIVRSIGRPGALLTICRDRWRGRGRWWRRGRRRRRRWWCGLN